MIIHKLSCYIETIELPYCRAPFDWGHLCSLCPYTKNITNGAHKCLQISDPRSWPQRVWIIETESAVSVPTMTWQGPPGQGLNYRHSLNAQIKVSFEIKHQLGWCAKWICHGNSFWPKSKCTLFYMSNSWHSIYIDFGIVDTIFHQMGLFSANLLLSLMLQVEMNEFAVN